MITNQDITKLKEVFATKEDLNSFATKDDLKAFATKDDLDKSEIRTAAGFADVQNQFVEVRADISILKEDVGILKEDVSDLKTEFREMKTQMTGMERNIIAAIQEIKQETQILNKRVSTLEGKRIVN